MTPERFQQIDRIFSAAAELPAAEREAFLERECAGDVELRREVRSLLAEDESAAAQLGSAVEEVVAGIATVSAPSEIGKRAGPYLLVRQIGRGGMGTVYQAIRDDGEFLQTVAVKLVHPGLDTAVILQRFRAERQILASLSHPNIAALLDGGSMADGRPFLVMEYIDGEAITEWCDRRLLPVEQRLDLFRQICGAVEHAHSIGIIHRDIKPGNVMVTSGGVPKLLDFGIAKLLLTELIPGGLPATETHARLLTPDYASPEQIRGDALTRATDIYSLGVVLYELLTGARPHSVSGRSPSEIEAAICTQTAMPASRAAKDTKLRGQIGGDLDNIVAMAMRKEPDRRYPSAAALADDLRSYLQGRPVLARKDSIVYRSRKWIRRRGLALVTTAALLLAIAVPAVYSVRGSRRVPDDVIALCNRAVELTRIDPRMRKLPPGVPPSFETAMDLYGRAAQKAPRYVAAWLGLAELAEMSLDFDQSRYRELFGRSRNAVDQVIRINAKESKAWELLGNLLHREWKFAESAEAFRRALELNPHAPFALRNYSTALLYVGRDEDAVQLLTNALEVSPDSNNPDPHVIAGRSRAILLAQLAVVQHRRGKHPEAIELARRSLDFESTFRIANWARGLSYEALGNTAEAEQDFRRAMELAPEDPRFAAALGHLLLGQRNRMADGRKVEQHVVELGERGRPISCHLALLRLASGDTDGALSQLEEAERRRDSNLPATLMDRRMEGLRRHPRFQAVFDRVRPFR